MAAKIRADFDQVGSLIKEGLMPEEPLMRAYWETIIRSWNALVTNITIERTAKDNQTYLESFENLYKLVIKYKEDNHPNVWVEPFLPPSSTS